MATIIKNIPQRAKQIILMGINTVGTTNIQLQTDIPDSIEGLRFDYWRFDFTAADAYNYLQVGFSGMFRPRSICHNCDSSYFQLPRACLGSLYYDIYDASRPQRIIPITLYGMGAAAAQNAIAGTYSIWISLLTK